MLPEMIGDYKIMRLIGAGANHQVYEARPASTPTRRVAIKLLHPALAGDDVLMKQLRREMATMERLTHPGILQVLELIESGRGPALVTEYLKGTDLGGRIRSGPTQVETAKDLVRQALDALNAAHACTPPLLHLDLKPTNLFLCEDGTLKLLDFGLSRSVWRRADEHRRAGVDSPTADLSGTAPYLAPEMWEGRDPTPAADVYAMGLIAWELLAGRPACNSASPAAAMAWHLGGELPNADIPSNLLDVIRRMVAREPGRRYPDARAALQAWTGLYLRMEPVGPRADDARNATPSLHPVSPDAAPLSSWASRGVVPTPQPKLPTEVIVIPAEKPPSSPLPPAAEASRAAAPAPDQVSPLTVLALRQEPLLLAAGQRAELDFEIAGAEAPTRLALQLVTRDGREPPPWAVLCEAPFMVLQPRQGRTVKVMLEPPLDAPGCLVLLRVEASVVDRDLTITESDWCAVSVQARSVLPRLVPAFMQTASKGPLSAKVVLVGTVLGVLGCLMGPDDACLLCLVTDVCKPTRHTDSAAWTKIIRWLKEQPPCEYSAMEAAAMSAPQGMHYEVSKDCKLIPVDNPTKTVLTSTVVVSFPLNRQAPGAAADKSYKAALEMCNQRPEHGISKAGVRISKDRHSVEAYGRVIDADLINGRWEMYDGWSYWSPRWEAPAGYYIKSIHWGANKTESDAGASSDAEHFAVFVPGETPADFVVQSSKCSASECSIALGGLVLDLVMENATYLTEVARPQQD